MTQMKQIVLKNTNTLLHQTFTTSKILDNLFAEVIFDVLHHVRGRDRRMMMTIFYRTFVS